MFEYFLMFLALCCRGWASRRNEHAMALQYAPSEERRTSYNLTSMENRQ